ncbi:MAG TPA: hypothetical protein PLM33_09365, partial [Acidobacteriota bacterium]|nr:hypothetical protein [Acidobacteriota bacterium]
MEDDSEIASQLRVSGLHPICAPRLGLNSESQVAIQQQFTEMEKLLSAHRINLLGSRKIAQGKCNKWYTSYEAAEPG